MPGLYLSAPAPDDALTALLHDLDLPLAACTPSPAAFPSDLPRPAFLRAASLAALLGQPIPADALKKHLSGGDPLPANVLRRHLLLRLSLLPFLRTVRQTQKVEGGVLLDDTLLIAAVSPDDTVDLPLPPGVWTELNGVCHTGRLKCMRGYNETPLLVRENVLLPVGMNGSSLAQRASTDADRLTLHWFEPRSQACCTLADGTRYHVQRVGEQITIDTDTSLPCHLIVHENGTERLIR